MMASFLTVTCSTLASGHTRLEAEGVVLDMVPAALAQMSVAELLTTLQQRAASAAQPVAVAKSDESAAAEEEQGDDGSAE